MRVCVPDTVVVGWRLWAQIAAGLQATSNNYVRTNGISLLRALLNNPAAGASALGESVGSTVAMFSHLLEVRASLNVVVLKDVLRLFQQWSKAAR